MRQATRSGLLLRARTMGFYLPQAAEFDVRPLIALAQRMGRRVCLPVLPRRGRVMCFARLREGGAMRPNRYGIDEPVDPRPRRARQLDLLFLPLVGFDALGHRLGMGGGYYDATLAFMRHRGHWHKPRLIGVAYECQRVDALPHDPWDMPLDAVLTERGLYRFSRASLKKTLVTRPA